MGSILLIFIGIYLFLSLFLFSSRRNANTEEYELQIDQKNLILSINKFKNTFPQYNPPFALRLNDYWEDTPLLNPYYNVYIYYEEERKLAYFWIRKKNDQETTVGLVWVARAMTTIGRWQYINKDLDNYENEVEKAKFKYRILSRVANCKINEVK